MKLIKIICPLIFIFIFSGCTDMAEPESLGYVVAIGIDTPKNSNSKYDITLQFANPEKISGGASDDGGKSGSDSIRTITVPAPGIYTAVNLANHVVSKLFTLSHTKLIVFSEDVAKSGLGDILETIGRSGDIRPNTYFAVSKCRAKDFLEAVNPETEVNPVRYYTMLFENDYSGFIPHNLSQDFYFFAASDEKSTVLPLCNISNKEGTQNSQSFDYQYMTEDFIAGEIPLSNRETEVMGMAVFDNDKMFYGFGDIKTEIYNLLTGRYKNGYASFRFSKAEDDPITLLLHQRKKPKISVDTSENIPKIKIKLFIDADFNTSTPKLSVEEHLALFTKEASYELKKSAEELIFETQEIGTDIIGFGSFLKRNFKTYSDFLKYNWKEKYPRAEIDVQVDLKVRRTGLVVRSDEK